MSKVFLDSVGLLGLWNVDDQWHVAAEKALREFTTNRVQVVTTTFVLTECGNAAARTPFRLSVERLRQKLDNDNGLIWPTEEDWRRAWAGYVSHEAAGAGIVDQITFAVMRRLNITDAFTNDRHFKLAGFNTLF